VDAARLDLKRQAFLLDQLNWARNGHLSRAEANKRIPKQIQQELTLTPSTANDFRRTLTFQGLVLEQNLKRSVSYMITDAGRAWLTENQRYLPLRIANGKVNVTADPALQQKRVTHILLQLVEIPEGGQTPTELNGKLGSQKSKLKLNAATARYVRGELVDRQLVDVNRTDRSEKYVLTPAGYSYLVTLSFDDLGKMKLSGSALTRLLRAARNGSAPPTERLDEPPVKLQVAQTSQLEAAVLEIFARLRRERHANTGLVPIHEVRSEIRSRFGEGSASHDVFDEVILSMRRTQKVALLSISDRSRATDAELRDSIVGVGETLFYLENVDGSPSG
jgi:predicted transcriptional regulator